MKTLQLTEIQDIELQILKHLDNFCRENDIIYYLSNGTLLGAVKYKGFIPWDDDIDVLIPREDYNKLLEIYPDESMYWLVYSNKYLEYPFTFAKLCDRNTEIENDCILKEKRLGIHIDIFPLDYLPNDKRKQFFLAKKRQYLITMLGLSISSFCPGKTILRTCVKYILTIVAKILGLQTFKKLLKSDCIDKRKDLGDKYRACIEWPVYGSREIIHSSVFENIIQMEFEGEKFFAPIGYDTYLRSLYGDYEKDPPIEFQKTHHAFKAYRL